MKKIFFAAFAILSSFAFISCDDDYTDGLMPPMTSDPETPQTSFIKVGIPLIDVW